MLFNMIIEDKVFGEILNSIDDTNPAKEKLVERVSVQLVNFCSEVNSLTFQIKRAKTEQQVSHVREYSYGVLSAAEHCSFLPLSIIDAAKRQITSALETAYTGEDEDEKD